MTVGTTPDFTTITELAGDPASREQIQRTYSRYYWAGEYARGKEVLEVACGAGQGLGYLASLAKRVVGADVSEPVLATARRHYGSRIQLEQFDAQQMPFADASFDVIIIFEAIYYIPDVRRFMREAHRVLRPGGYLLIATANKDLFDFARSPFSVDYYGVVELRALLSETGFDTRFFGDTPFASVSKWQRLLRPAKRFAAATGLMPKSKRAKAIFKRIVFGPIQTLPAEIGAGGDPGPAPVPLDASQPDVRHKVIFCEARRR
jgi:ubiquinone/menaquinone biosynthesis C-methylase UbiE